MLIVILSVCIHLPCVPAEEGSPTVGNRAAETEKSTQDSGMWMDYAVQPSLISLPSVEDFSSL